MPLTSRSSRARLFVMLVSGVALLGPLAIVSPSVARADDSPSQGSDAKERCVARYEGGQQLRRERRLAEARRAFAECVQSCREPLSFDCARWAQEVDTLAPTVRVRVVDENGVSVRDAVVRIDGAVQIAHDGESVTLDPGARTFEAQSEGRPPARLTITLEEGEREKEARLQLAPRADPRAPHVEDAPRGLPLWSYVLGGAGGVAIAGGVAVAIKGSLDRSELRESCAPDCSSRAVDNVHSKWLVGGTLIAAGVVMSGTAVVIGLTARGTARVAAAPNGARLELRF
jgi:hypothetical protein